MTPSKIEVRQYHPKQAYLTKRRFSIQSGDVEVGLTSLFSADGLDGLASGNDIHKVIQGLFPKPKTVKQPKSKTKTEQKVTTSAETSSGGTSERIRVLEKENQRLRAQISETLSVYEAERADLKSTRFRLDEEIKSQRKEIQRLEAELSEVIDNFSSQKAEDANQQKVKSTN